MSSATWTIWEDVFMTISFRGRTRLGVALALLVLVALSVLVPTGSAVAEDAPGFTEIVSVNNGSPGNQDSERPSVSESGRFVAFASFADNLVPEDTNGVTDIFVRDRLTGTTQRVSVSSAGRQADGPSGLLGLMGGPSISGDGRYIAFDSDATNLARGDRDISPDVFVHDRLTGETTLVSVPSAVVALFDAIRPDISRDGRFVAFKGTAELPDFGGFRDELFVHDREAGVTELITRGHDGSVSNGDVVLTPDINADGRFVYFTSFASNYVPGDPDNSDLDAYVFDRQMGAMEPITSNQPATGVIQHGVGGGISGNGRYVTFSTQDTTFLTTDANGGADDAFLFDRDTDTYHHVSVNSSNVQADDSTIPGDVSDDGRLIVLASHATNFGGGAADFADVFVRDRIAGTTRLVSVGNGGEVGDRHSGVISGDPLSPDAMAMTPNGGVIAWQSRSSTFVPETTSDTAFNIFVRDMRQQADLNLTKVASPDPATARNPVTYTLTLRNDGPGVATAVTVEDTLPANATFVSATASQGSCVRGGKGRTDGVITCDIGTLAVTQSATVTIVVTPSKAGTLTNSATAHSNEPDGDQTDNAVTTTTTVNPRQ
jgi:uncharacterized repeat protein (TIGR01451 family)